MKPPLVIQSGQRWIPDPGETPLQVYIFGPMDATPALCLTTPRTVLRSLHPADLANLHAILSHPEVARYDEWDACTVEDTQQELDEALRTPFGTPGVWNLLAVDGLEQGSMVGCLYLKPPGDNSGRYELGFFFNPAYHGRGLALESVQELVRHVRAMGAPILFSRVDPRNLPSVRLLGRLGMQLEREIPSACFCKGEWCDEHIYSLDLLGPTLSARNRSAQ